MDVDRFEEIRRLDQEALVTDLLGSPASRSSNKAYWTCPFHDDKKPSLLLNLDGQFVGRMVCFPCGWRGDAVDLYVQVKQMSKREVLDLLLPRPERPVMTKVTLRQFCEARAWDLEIIQDLGLHEVRDKFGGPRLRFPFWQNKEMVYWQDRALYDSKIRWLSHEGTCPCPFEADRLAEESDTVFVTEGLSDTVSLLHDFPDAVVVGIPGASAAKASWAPFFNGLHLIVIPDNDEAGELFASTMSGFGASSRVLRVPREFKDLTEWRASDPETFPYEFKMVLDADT